MCGLERKNWKNKVNKLGYYDNYFGYKR